ncbi:MAG: DUF4920 domain-containing protein [Alphaproteobacteria bacterium]|nr:DUF4920 domain-containing protein [Alphaproteobacteria bacterium]
MHAPLAALRLHLVVPVLLAACGTPSADPVAPEAATAQASHEGHEGHAEPAAQAAAPDADGWASYGDAITATDTLAAKALLDAPATYADQAVFVEGEVADVCQKAGCWMVVTDGDRTMRVTMKDHAFGLPKDCTGATARIQGTIVGKPIDPETVAHYAGEAARPEVLPEAGKEGMTYELVASAVQLKR